MSNYDKAIKASPKDRDCENCIHKIGLDDISYCECWECKFEQKENDNGNQTN